MELVFRGRAITTGGERAVDVGVTGGRVRAVAALGDLTAGRIVELADDEVLLPGLVDTHVHVNDPGRSEWEGFGTATRAAAAGGITTIVDMPLNSLPPTVDVAALEVKRTAAAGRVHVDVGFWGGAIPGNGDDLRELHEAGVFGFKCFLLHSGVDEFPPLGTEELEADLRIVRDLGATMIVHAEDAGTIEHAPRPHGNSYADFLGSRPREAENVAIARVVELARRTGARVHILHLSSSDALGPIRGARRDVAITAETCPHYLTFSAEEIPDGATQFKCCPPIRESRNRELLWQGLADGTIDTVVSDHSPCTPELKRFDLGDFGEAWGGIASLQVGLPAVWTGARERGFTLADVVRWMAHRPAAQLGLVRKGHIAEGADADFCVFAPDEQFVVDVAKLHHRNPVSAYHGRRLTGVVRSTWLRGHEVDGEPRGRLLARGGNQVHDRPVWTNEPDLASRQVGAGVVWANDELFAERENLIKPGQPEFRPSTFGHKGQIYDGWETRRRREPGADQAIVRLGLPGVVAGVVVDTAFFTGNYPPFASVEAVAAEGYPSPAELSELDWTTIVVRAPLRGDSENFFAVDSPRRWTHVRLTIYPDGGVARLRVHGAPIADPRLLDLASLDLAALENGARVTGASNMFYSSPNNLISPGFAAVMGDGWETARRRDDDHDWVRITLAGAGVPRLAELDTSHFKGNAPGWAALSGSVDGESWFEVLPRTRLQPDTRHRFPLEQEAEIRYLRLDIYPDGGMARLRLYGGLTEQGRKEFVGRFQAAQG